MTHLDADAVVLRAKKEKQRVTAAAGSNATSSNLSWEEQKKRRNRAQQLPARRDRTLAAIEAAEARRKIIHDSYASPGFFERTSQQELDALNTEDLALGSKIDALMAEWEELENEIAKLSIPQ